MNISQRLHGTGILTYICLKFMVNADKSCIHGAFGYMMHVFLYLPRIHGFVSSKTPSKSNSSALKGYHRRTFKRGEMLKVTSAVHWSVCLQKKIQKEHPSGFLLATSYRCSAEGFVRFHCKTSGFFINHGDSSRQRGPFVAAAWVLPGGAISPENNCRKLVGGKKKLLNHQLVHYQL